MGKAVSQVELVRQGFDHVTPGGSFTLVTGVLARGFIWMSCILVDHIISPGSG